MNEGAVRRSDADGSRRRAEDVLLDTQRRLDAVLNNASVAIFLMDERQHCIYMNAAAERLTGYSFAETQGRALHDVVHHTRPDGSPFPLAECPIDRAFPENNNMQGEEVFVHKDGRFYPVAFTASPIRDAASKTVGTIIEVRDISAEKAAQLDLAERTRTLEILNRTGAALGGELDLHRLVQMVTDAGVELTGAQFGAFFYNVLNPAGDRYMLYTLSGVDRSHFDQFPMPRDTAVFHPTFVGEGVVRSDDITADPRYGKSAPHFGMPKGHLPVRSYLAVPVMSRSGEVIGGLFFGHEQRGVFDARVEQVMVGLAAQAAIAVDNARLFQTTQQLNATLEQQVEARTRERDMVWRISQDLFALIGADSCYTAVNPAWSALGYAQEELIGMHGSALVHPEDLEARAGEFAPLEWGEPARNIDLRIRTKSGDYRWFTWTALPAADGLVFAEGRDVTERKQLEEQLRQAQKMEAVGQLTGGIAHDFNNLLTGISGSLELMRKRIAQGRIHELERYADAATTSANRAAALTHRLLAFSRRQPLDPKPVDANRLAASMEDLLRRTIGETIDFELVTAGGLWRTLCDPHQLESAVLNLAINARDAMPEGGKLTIETCNAHLDTAYAARQRDVKPGQYICICVTDTGTGMSPEVIARAFDPFFTTKPLGQGTGLGLSMIYGFARQSEGYVKIYSELGQGTTVKLYLPRYRGEAEADETPGATATAHTGGQTGEVVLVVEDEPSVRGLVVEVLRDLGYRAHEAADGLSGLRLAQTLDRIDLLITDVGLPGLNGRQLADAARQVRPGLNVLFMTGYAENAAVANGFLDPGMEMVTKPFALEALAARIRQMIEAEKA